MQAPDPGPYGAMFTGYDGPIIDYYRSNVIGGPGAFAMAVDPADGLAPAIVRKLVLEIAWRHPEPPSAIGDEARERPDIDRLFGRRNG